MTEQFTNGKATDFNKNGGSQPVPGFGDITVRPMEGNQKNPADDLFSFPISPEQWINRADLDEDQISAIVEMDATDRALSEGYTDWALINWEFAGLMNSRHGRARDDFKEAIIGMRVNKMMENAWSRLSSMTHGGNSGPGR